MSAVILAFAFAAFAGCGSTHVVQREATAAWLPEASRQLTGTGVTVADRKGKKHEGTVASLDEHQIQLMDGRRDTSVCFPLDSVLTINSGSNGGSVLLGTLVGMVTGGLVGVMIEAIIGPEPTRSSEMFPNGLGNYRGVILVAAGTTIGGVLGGVGTGLATRTHDYVIMDADSARQKSERRHIAR